MGYSGAYGETDSWKDLTSKISWHCPFKGAVSLLLFDSIEDPVGSLILLYRTAGNLYFFSRVFFPLAETFSNSYIFPIFSWQKCCITLWKTNMEPRNFLVNMNKKLIFRNKEFFVANIHLTVLDRNKIFILKLMKRKTACVALVDMIFLDLCFLSQLVSEHLVFKLNGFLGFCCILRENRRVQFHDHI